ncbi:hypothetical protein H257_07458 [Aphanomyces astaci]|uniref:RNase H type-1 domain-containing protein n=1 Tax=Aphanomyces astaci TaxID=112090 RepID=W4GIF5_APHAT|nr:hypothetical protein H257_07458 [Aphanomyces astaci]ETV79457.1 hypothetical protein H257_07458 [Aphanomyces astaci]|eukprot:XP_009831298.1 hypothetical protein H257_07458 [Aphanomyces astaci]
MPEQASTRQVLSPPGPPLHHPGDSLRPDYMSAHHIHSTDRPQCARTASSSLIEQLAWMACGGVGAIAMHRDDPSLGKYTAHHVSTSTTTNITEYDDLIRGLQLVKTMGLSHLTIYGDRKLVIRQMRGLYRVCHVGLRDVYRRARSLVVGFHCTWIHRIREDNQAANLPSKRAPDEAKDFSSLSGPPLTPLTSIDFAAFLGQDLPSTLDRFFHDTSSFACTIRVRNIHHY